MQFKINGKIKITDELGNLLLEKENSIHYENLSVAIAQSLGAGPLESSSPGFVYTMNFGNGGTTVNSSGIITYNPPNTVGATAQLYNQTYSKVINSQFSATTDTTNNYITYDHTSGKAYTDVVIACRLDYGEPSDQLTTDSANSLETTYAFDELGLFSYEGQLLTHVIFSPLIKSLNRSIDISYTLRISTLSSLSI
ncbi:Uncharacterised protein [uncultured archaeon]|nr:Uncharacterised protein [uncultured archaeon]